MFSRGESKRKELAKCSEIMADSCAGPILDFILKRPCIKLYRALKNSKNSYFDKTFFYHLVRILGPVSSDLLFPPHVFCKPWEEGVIFFAGVRNETQLWGPVYRMDDIVPQASQHRRPLVCIQALLIEFGLMYLTKGLIGQLSSSVYLERNHCVMWLF